jgi:glycosyltransferase involved in cell wall biosynthesis
MKEIKLTDSAKVSVIVPILDAHKFLVPMLNSLVMQRMENFEIIVVDATSKGSPKPLIDKFSFDRRLQYIRTDARTLGGALNVGHEASKGDYITRCDSASIYYSNFLEALSQAMDAAVVQNLNIGLMYSDFAVLNGDGKVIDEVLHESPQTKEGLAEGYDIGVSLMYTRELFSLTGPYWDRPCEDYNWVVRAAQATNFGLIKAVLVAHRPRVNKDVEAATAAANDCKTLAAVFAGAVPA